VLATARGAPSVAIFSAQISEGSSARVSVEEVKGVNKDKDKDKDEDEDEDEESDEEDCDEIEEDEALESEIASTSSSRIGGAHGSFHDSGRWASEHA